MDTIKPPNQTGPQSNQTRPLLGRDHGENSEKPHLEKDITQDHHEEEYLAHAAGKKLLSWTAPEYHHYEKNNDWYWWVGLFAVLLLAAAVWQRSVLFGILILIGWFVVVLYAVKRPDDINFALTEHGFLVEKTLYPWQSLRSFWIFHNPPFPTEVSFESKKTLMPYIRVPLGNKKIAEVRAILKQHLREIEQEESVIDHLAHLARF